MKYTPLDFQQKVINDASFNMKQGKNVLIASPTRSGKSVFMCYFVELGFHYKRPVLIIAHNDILIKQISEDLLESGIPHGIIKAGHYESKDIIQVASVQTLHKRLANFSPTQFPLVIWDEVHHIKAKTFLEVRKYFTGCRWLGLTATPTRPSSGDGFDDIFDIMVKGPSKKELIKRKFLVGTKVASPMPEMLKGLVERGGDYTKESSEKALHETFIHGEYVEHYFKYGKDKKGLVFCPTVDFSNEVAAHFNANGVPAVVISSRDSKEERKEKLDKYYKNEYKLLVSVSLFLEGFTIRECEIIICLRPTASIIVWLQMAGRGSMKSEGKDSLILVDCCNNMYTLGHPDQDFDWKLKGETKEERKTRIQANMDRIVRCDNCKWPYDLADAVKEFNPNSSYFISHPEEKERWHMRKGVLYCPYCGAPRATNGRVLKQIDGELKLVSLDDYEKYQAEQQWKIEEEWIAEQKEKEEKKRKWQEVKNAKTIDELEAIEKERGYKNGWAENMWQRRRYARSKYTAPKF